MPCSVTTSRTRSRRACPTAASPPASTPLPRQSPSSGSSAGSPCSANTIRRLRQTTTSAQPRSHLSATASAIGGAEGHSPLLRTGEDLQEEQEHVQHVKEDRRGYERRGVDIGIGPQPLEVEHGEPGEDHQAED